MILLSDFEDYYDHALKERYANGTFFRRRAHITRREGFEYLHRLWMAYSPLWHAPGAV